MHANSPSSYLASLALHGAAAALVFGLTFWMARNPEVPPMIFELVAGPPTNPEATEAGTSAPQLDVDLPKIKPLSPEAMRPQPEPVPEPPKVVPKQPVKTPPKQESKKVEVKKAEVKKTEPPKQVSYDQFVKQHGKPKPKQVSKAPSPIKAPRINTDALVNELKRGGGGGTALTRPEQDLLGNYLSQLIQALRLAHEKPPGVEEGLEAQVTFNIAANGDMTNVRITRSSGDPDFDRSAVEAFRRVGSIGPPPNRKADVWTLRFRVRDDG